MVTQLPEKDRVLAHKLRPPAVLKKAPQTAGDIVIVDDDVLIAQFIAEALQDEDYSVRVFHDGASALLDIVKRQPGLMLLDVAMPVLLGDDLLRYLRGHGFADLPIIMMTSSPHPERYLADGATDILPKPFDLSIMLDKVVHYLPSRSS